MTLQVGFPGTRLVAALICWLAVPLIASAQQYQFTTLTNMHMARGINNSGDIAGDGGILSNGVYTPFPYPSADAGTTVINRNNDWGWLVGQYSINGVTHSFSYASGLGGAFGFPLPDPQFSNLDSAMPGGVPLAIDDQGDIAGRLIDQTGYTRGFMGTSGGFNTVDYPGAFYNVLYQCAATLPDPQSLLPNNFAGCVGETKFLDQKLHGFYWDGFAFHIIDYPYASATSARGINLSGQIVGQYTDGAGQTHGFLLNGTFAAPYKGTFYSVDVDGATSTTAMGINDLGQIVGYFSQGTDTTLGFLASPAPDGTVGPAGGTVTAANLHVRMQVPPGAFGRITAVKFGVLGPPYYVPPPKSHTQPATPFVVIGLSPEPAFPLRVGLTLVLPTTNNPAPGDRVDLYRLDASTGLLVPEPDVNGNPVVGAIDPTGLTATFSSVAHLSTVVGLVPDTIQVAIDIKPPQDPPRIQLGSNGNTPVAILSSATFNAPAMVDQSTLTFGHSGNEKSLVFCGGVEDINGDGLPDLVCQFNTIAASFQSGDTQGVLKGKTMANVHLQGTDAIQVVQ